MAENLPGCPKARIILQQCLSGKLQVRPSSENTPAEYVEISRGLVVYVCFLKGATDAMIEQMGKAVLNARLSEADGKLVSVKDLPGDILIIPQATLGGRLKGKVMQYHNNIDKDTGRDLYNKFVKLCKFSLEDHMKTKDGACQVKCGTYGNRQVFQMDTNGPYTHVLEF